ncbi:MAG TPA: Gmad2 immunoglobulin-like domain-containing protein [Nocardioides sp.]|nr:Gmad2 immunoglobulin-like domain-containing protein [Nocardioides sp.]
MTRHHRIPALLAVTVLALAGCGSDDTGADQRPASGSTKDQQPSGEESPSQSSSPAAEQVTVPVYFTGDTPQGTRLYREFRRVDAGDPLGAALTLAASGQALDPDYSTLLPDGTFTTSGDATVALPDDSWTRRPDGMSESDALLAVQQLVYTAQGVLQSRDPITFTDSSGAATQIFGIASEDGFAAADPIKTLSLVSITTPEEGATVSGSFTATGVSSSFEATTPWEVRDASGKAVVKGSAMAEGWMDKLYPWQTEVDVSDLAPGDYTFVVQTDDPSGGEGPGPMVDTRSITVQ